MTFNQTIPFASPDYIGCDDCGTTETETLTCEGCNRKGCACEVRNTSCGSARCGDPDANLCTDCHPNPVGCRRCASE